MRMNKVYFPIVIAVAVAVGLLLGSKLNPSTETAFLNRNANKNKLNKLIDFIEKEYVDSLNTDSIVDLTVTEILAKLAAYPEIVIRAANSYEPHQVGNYLKELAALFHGWYNEHKVLNDDAELTQARLLLSVNVQQVLRNGLELLGVSAPESM